MHRISNENNQLRKLVFTRCGKRARPLTSAQYSDNTVHSLVHNTYWINKKMTRVNDAEWTFHDASCKCALYNPSFFSAAERYLWRNNRRVLVPRTFMMHRPHVYLHLSIKHNFFFSSSIQLRDILDDDCPSYAVYASCDE